MTQKKLFSATRFAMRARDFQSRRVRPLNILQNEQCRRFACKVEHPTNCSVRRSLPLCGRRAIVTCPNA